MDGTSGASRSDNAMISACLLSFFPSASCVRLDVQWRMTVKAATNQRFNGIQKRKKSRPLRRKNTTGRDGNFMAVHVPGSFDRHSDRNDIYMVFRVLSRRRDGSVCSESEQKCATGALTSVLFFTKVTYN